MDSIGAIVVVVGVGSRVVMGTPTAVVAGGLLVVVWVLGWVVWIVWIVWIVCTMGAIVVLVSSCWLIGVVVVVVVGDGAIVVIGSWHP